MHYNKMHLQLSGATHYIKSIIKANKHQIDLKAAVGGKNAAKYVLLFIQAHF